MSKVTINQFHSGTAIGDAITNQMRMLRSFLRCNGYHSEIYAEHIVPELESDIHHISQYKENPENVLIVHHSMGFTPKVFDKIKRLADRKLLIYHNITPEKFFDDVGTKKAIRLGLNQVREYRDYLEYFIADSNYNRKNLLEMGYPNTIDVIPVQISLDRFDTCNPDERILKQTETTTNILFVGRIVWNKRQLDAVKAFAVYYKYFNQNSRLYLVGDTSMQGYVHEIKSLAQELKIENAVVLPGKVSEEELKAYYQNADLFLCMSEHEGFGVPLLEAMKMQIPVIAMRSSAVPETMGGAGIVVNRKSSAYIGALIDEIVTNQELNHRLVQRQNKRIQEVEQVESGKQLLQAVTKMRNRSRQKTIQMQGPFETSYSLAIVNRKLIEAMDDLGKYDVSIYCTEGPGDYLPKEQDLKDKPHAKKLWEKSASVSYPDVTIRNMYPPRVHDVKGGLNFQAFGWEESVIPAEYIENFNRFLDGIGTMSEYVTEKLIECGIKIPVRTMGIGVELSPNFSSIKPYSLKTKRKIKFLHISSAFPRKGVDILLNAYFEAFTNKDDVCLILKTFPNPHNTVGQMLTELRSRYPNGPEVEWIDMDLPQEKLESLYKAADCYVSVARGEGFGLPVAEAMLAKLPVIVSPNSGMADFSNSDTALLVGFDMAPANTHLTTGDNLNISLWAEPRKEELVEKLRYFAFDAKREDLDKMVNRAFALISTRFTWQAVAQRWTEFIEDVEQNQTIPKVALVTTWNNKCGIAEYARMGVEASSRLVDYTIYPNYGVDLLRPDEDYVAKRSWHSAFQGDMDSLNELLLNSKNEIVHFHFNFGFFNLNNLAKSIEKLSPVKKVIITFHKTADASVDGKIVSLRKISKALNQCHALVVHQQEDYERLIQFGVNPGRIKLIPLGQPQYQLLPSKYAKERLGLTSSLVIGSYGFLLPHKGIKEVIQAMPEILKNYPDALYMPVCAQHQAPESEAYLKECMEEAEKLGVSNHVRMETRYLANEESMQYLQACDLMCMVYKPSKESASGAVRFCLAAGRPTITTEQPIFAEFKDFTYQIPATDPKLIADAVLKMQTDVDLQKQCVDKMQKYTSGANWYSTAFRYRELYTELLK